jgi:hypothetical protein
MTRTRSYGEKTLRPLSQAARVIPIRPQPLPDPKITFVDTNHVIVKEDDGESVVVFDGAPYHLLSLPHPGRGAVILVPHQRLTVLGNGAKVDGQGEWMLEAREVMRFTWRYGSWWGSRVSGGGYLDLRREGVGA